MTASTSFISSPSDHSKYLDGLTSGGTLVTNATQSSCIRNREFICGILKNYLIGPSKDVFEVGSGTGDQTVYFCNNFPNVTWQPSDRTYHADIKETLSKALLRKNQVKDPVQFDIDKDEIEGVYDVIYSSNVLHCIPWESAKNLFKKTGTALKQEGLFILYGPYNIKSSSNTEGYTSIGNQNFDAKLKAQDKRLGLRDIEDVQGLAKENNLSFIAKHDHAGVNNYILVFKKVLGNPNQ